MQNNPDVAVNRGRLAPGSKVDPNRDLKIGIWIYFLLLIFEGALRKWFLPGLATPLLIVRDPVAVWLVVKCWQRGLLPSSIYLNIMFTIGVISIFTAIFFGHGNLWVAIYGARPFLIHFPLVFVIGKIFNRDDVIKIGIATLWITIPMTILIGLQFYSPQSAWVNRGVGGDMAGAGYSGAMGFFRPPATFSFTTGTTSYYSYAACFVFYFLFNIRQVNTLVLIAATLALFAAIPFSISRGLLYQNGVTLVFAILAVARKPKYLGKMIFAIAGSFVLLIVLSQISFLQKPLEAFTLRFTSAGESEGGAIKGTLGNRFVTGLTRGFSDTYDLPYFGYGVGMGSKVGAMLLTGNSKAFLIAEDEWPRLVGEIGPLMGIIAILTRIIFAFQIAFACYKKLGENDLLPWMLLSFGFLAIAQMIWSQPTYLGFFVILGGLL
ncbi:MAG: hypothetical protein EOP43_03360, partial [Sphingobacteriaceae bacterium]